MNKEKLNESDFFTNRAGHRWICCVVGAPDTNGRAIQKHYHRSDVLIFSSVGLAATWLDEWDKFKAQVIYII